MGFGHQLDARLAILRMGHAERLGQQVLIHLLGEAGDTLVALHLQPEGGQIGLDVLAGVQLVEQALGLATGYITRLGHDSFGNFLRGVLAHEGIDTRYVVADVAHPTGFMLKTRAHSASSTASTDPIAPTPALLTTMSIPPSSAAIVPSAALVVAGSETSD